MIILNGKSPEEAYFSLYPLSEGTVFKIESDYETVMERIIEYTPSGRTFEVFPITPGTLLFTTYGPNHCVVTRNEPEGL